MTEKIPKFPNFRSFSFDDISWYRDYYYNNNLSPYADISPDDLFVWLNYNNDLTISDLDGVLVLRYTNVLENNKVNIIPLAKSLNDITIERVMSFLNEKNLPLELREIPSGMCNMLSKEKWLISEDRDSYEYILDNRKQYLLEGNEFSRQRRRICFFEREHASDNIEIKLHREVNDEVQDAFLQYIKTMQFNSNAESTKNNFAEPIAMKRNLEFAPTFHKQALIIKINNKVVSLALISCLDEHSVAINHLKVDYSIQYIFQYTIYQLAKILCENGVKEMNIEQDLGIEGIRTFKERLQPSRFLEKKIISSR